MPMYGFSVKSSKSMIDINKLSDTHKPVIKWWVCGWAGSNHCNLV